MSKIDPQQKPAAVPTKPEGHGLRSDSAQMAKGSGKFPIKEKPGGEWSLGKATGPRTESGKKRSSQNSIKFGILSKATLLKDESRSEYQQLLYGFRESLAPVGELENLLVEKLVTNIWRHKRMLLAEGAEIQKNSKFLEFDRRQLQQKDGEEISRTGPLGTARHPIHVGLIWSIQNPGVLASCLEMLTELREGIKANGLVVQRDDALLGKIYGDQTHLQGNLRDGYLMWLNTAYVTEAERSSKRLPTPEQCKKFILREISQEINRLELYRGQLQSTEKERMNLEILRQGVPDSPGLERLLRYSASLERDFDRTLSQLERIQRMRRGQSVPPRVEVNLNA
jgi:hypothetical protein